MLPERTVVPCHVGGVATFEPPEGGFDYDRLVEIYNDHFLTDRYAHLRDSLEEIHDALEIRFARSHPVINYVLRLDSADLTRFDVEMRVRNAPDTFRLAMAALAASLSSQSQRATMFSDFTP